MHMHHEHHEHVAPPKEEQVALLKYFAGHNAEHTHELSHLAEDFAAAGNKDVSEDILEAVEFYNKGNDILAHALSHINE